MRDIAWRRIPPFLAYVFILGFAVANTVSKAVAFGDTITLEWSSTALLISSLLIWPSFIDGMQRIE